LGVGAIKLLIVIKVDLAPNHNINNVILSSYFEVSFLHDFRSPMYIEVGEIWTYSR